MTFGWTGGQAAPPKIADKDTTTLDSVKLGTSDPALLNTDKKYKIRFISKSTGKKFDFNIGFKSDFIVNPEQNIIASQAVPEYVKWEDFSSDEDI